MKVKKLIQELQKLDPELDVYEHMYDGTYDLLGTITVTHLELTGSLLEKRLR